MSESPSTKLLKTCLLAVSNKTDLLPLARKLHLLKVQLYATTGTCDYLKKSDIPATEVSSLTQHPDLLGGRVKTLHPKVFGGLLYRSQEAEDMDTLAKYNIPQFDMLIVNLYPFEAALEAKESEDGLIEKIDIGGVSLLRAAAKNFKEIWVISAPTQYASAQKWLEKEGPRTTLSLRREAARYAFHVSSHYDTAIFSYFNASEPLTVYKNSITDHVPLRYGENPHQTATFYGSLTKNFDQYQGKELSYNNLLDLEAAVDLLRAIGEQKAAFVIIKHTNPCGVGVDVVLERAYKKAYACDSLSAFGGIFATNRPVDQSVAEHMAALFFEVLIAPDFSPEALHILSSKKQRRILRYHRLPSASHTHRSLLDGVLQQSCDPVPHDEQYWEIPTLEQPNKECMDALRTANYISQCARSNSIVLFQDGQLIGCGAGQTSRIDAAHLAVNKAKRAGLPLKGAVMASEAFFPFPDCVEIATQVGIKAIIQPGGSKNDNLSIAHCDTHHIPMVFTHRRHFRH